MNSDPKLESVFVGNKTHKNFGKQKNNYYRLTDWMKVYSSRQVRQPVFRKIPYPTCLSKSNLWREMKRIGDNVLIMKTTDLKQP